MEKILLRKPFYEVYVSLPKEEQEKIYKKIQVVANDINECNYNRIKKLKLPDENIFRFRDGDWRILFGYGSYDGETVMDIFLIDLRRNIYEKVKRNYRNYKHEEIFKIIEYDEKDNVQEDIISENISENSYNLEKYEIPAHYFDYKQFSQTNFEQFIKKFKYQIYDLNKTTKEIVEKIVLDVQNKITNNRNVLLLQGAPGTGKSFIIREIANKFKQLKQLSLIIIPTIRLKEDFYIKYFESLDIEIAHINNEKINDQDINDFIKNFNDTGMGILTFHQLISLLDNNINLKEIHSENIKKIKTIIEKKHKRFKPGEEDLYKLEPEKIYLMFLLKNSGIKTKVNRNKDYLFKNIDYYYQLFINSNMLRTLEENENITNPFEKLDKINLSKNHFKINNLNLFVDETQEYFLKENLFLLKFWEINNNSNNGSLLLYTGDLFQRCNITDFSFLELEQQIYSTKDAKTKILEKKELENSYRIPKELAEYAKKYVNVFLEKVENCREITLIESEKCLKSCSISRNINYTVNFENFINELNKLKNRNGDKKLVIICDEKEKKIQSIPQTNSIITISTKFIKGLEFDTAIIYNVFYDDESDMENFEKVAKIYLSLTRCTTMLLHLVDSEKVKDDLKRNFSFEELNDYSIISDLITTFRQDQILNILKNILEKIEVNFNIEIISEFFKQLNLYTQQKGFDKIELKKIIEKFCEISSLQNFNLKEEISNYDLTPIAKGLIYHHIGEDIIALPLLFDSYKEEFDKIFKNYENDFEFLFLLKKNAKNLKFKNFVLEKLIKLIDNYDGTIIKNENKQILKDAITISDDIEKVFNIFVVSKLNHKTEEVLGLWEN
ncbi:MAG: hypothetical protein ABIN35_04510 [candidate division WOR-3 bacterium]